MSTVTPLPGHDARADYIRRIVDEAPRLTAEQRDRLALILRGVTVSVETSEREEAA